jgi:uncharacterized membrane protein YuzA (DUF378 family)
MDGPPTAPPSASPLLNALRVFRPSHRHTAFTATLLLMLSAFLSRIIGLVRVKYIAYLFGAGPQTDAFNSAFQLPDMIAYFLVGGAASVTFVTILSRYRESGREEDGTRAMSVILTSMLLVLGGAILLAEFFAPLYVRWWFKGFTPEQAALCTSMTRILLPGSAALLCRRRLRLGHAGSEAVRAAGRHAAGLQPWHHLRRSLSRAGSSAFARSRGARWAASSSARS